MSSVAHFAKSIVMAPCKHILILALSMWGHTLPCIDFAIELISTFGCKVSFATSAGFATELVKRNLIPAEYKDRLTIVPVRNGYRHPHDAFYAAKDLSDIVMACLSHFDVMGRVLRTLHDLPGEKASASDLEIFPQLDGPIDHAIVEQMMFASIPVFQELGIPITSVWPMSPVSAPSIIKTLQHTKELMAAGKEVVPCDTVLPTTRDGVPMHPAEVAYFSEVFRLHFTCKHILLNTYDDLDRTTLDDLKRFPETANTTFSLVGPLHLYRQQSSINARWSGAHELKIAAWLSHQQDAKRSVVYISHGTIAHLTGEQTTQFAYALSQIEQEHPVSFIWSMRTPLLQHIPADILPNFAVSWKSSADTALTAPVLVVDWAPQSSVLAHPAVRAFVTHCGWNSSLEAISAGVPMVAWPMFSEQFTNAEFLAAQEHPAVLLVPGTAASTAGRVVPAAEIIDAVTRVLDQEQEYGRNAQKLGNLARAAVTRGSGSSARQLDAWYKQAVLLE
ncbi:hypothetical protein RI367_002443 [Sorochytrium milnesiophthora]